MRLRGPRRPRAYPHFHRRQSIRNPGKNSSEPTCHYHQSSRRAVNALRPLHPSLRIEPGLRRRCPFDAGILGSDKPRPSTALHGTLPATSHTYTPPLAISFWTSIVWELVCFLTTILWSHPDLFSKRRCRLSSNPWPHASSLTRSAEHLSWFMVPLNGFLTAKSYDDVVYGRHTLYLSSIA